MAVEMIDAYDTRTGKKLPQRVPAGWLKIFKHLSATPKQKARTGKAQPSKSDKES